jgi:hypothetical protein
MVQASSAAAESRYMLVWQGGYGRADGETRKSNFAKIKIQNVENRKFEISKKVFRKSKKTRTKKIKSV